MNEDDLYPRDIRIDGKYEDEFEKFVTRRSSPFYKANKSDLYILAATIGWWERASQKSDTSNRYVLFQQKTFSDEEMWVLKSIAVASNTEDENKLDILNDGTRTIKAIEHYANGGIRILSEWREGPQDLTREVTTRMVKAYDSLESESF